MNGTYYIPSRTGGPVYRVTRFPTGAYACTCPCPPGRLCWHKQFVNQVLVAQRHIAGYPKAHVVLAVPPGWKKKGERHDADHA